MIVKNPYGGAGGESASIFVTGLPHYEPKGVPSGYEELHWIESTGTQYIDTGISPTANTKFICKFAFTEWSTNGTILSAQANNYANFVLRSNSSGNINGYVQGNAISGAISLGTAYDYAMVSNGSSTILKVGDTQVSSVNAVCNNVSTTFALFADHENTTYKAYAKGRLYISELYDNDTLVRNFVPCIRTSDGAVGMYDKVSNAFFGNSGTGVFLAGARVVELPTGYQQVEYIQSSGTQYIDTGIDLTGSVLRYKGRVLFSAVTDTACGAMRAGSVGKDCVQFYCGSNYIDLYSRINDVLNSTNTMSTTSRGVLCEADMQTINAIPSTWNNLHFFLFARNVGGSPSNYCTMRIDCWRQFTDNALVRDFIPVISPTNEVGMYDLVSEQFFGNAGTGVFTAGARVDMPTTVTCTTPKGEVLQGVWETKTVQAPYEIPTMTSNTTPSGVASYVNVGTASNPAYYAFDNGADTYAYGYNGGSLPRGVQYEMAEEAIITDVYAVWQQYQGGSQTYGLSIQLSENASTWTTVYSNTVAVSGNVRQTVSEEIAPTRAKYLRFMLTSETESSHGILMLYSFQVSGYTSSTTSGYSFPDLKDYGTYTLTARQGNRVSTEEVLVDMATEYEVEMMLFPPECVAAYYFDYDLLDATNNDNDLFSSQGTPTFVSTGLSGLPMGVHFTASDRISASNGIAPSTGDFAFVFWLKTDAAYYSYTPGIIGLAGTSLTANGYSGGNDMRGLIHSDQYSYGAIDAFASGSLNGSWHMYGIVYNNGTIYKYFDGNLAGTQGRGRYADTGAFSCGGILATFTGIKVFNKAISSVDILELYNGGQGR